jgi:putative peptide zinc metalloprotease protein
MSDRATFSPFWHRVRALKPRLRPHVQSTRQHYRGGRWHVLHDPASNAFYRLGPVSYELISLFDGKRTVEEAWDACLVHHGDEAPTQNEVIQLIGQLYSANLLSADIPPETEQLLRRGRDRLKQRFASQAIGLMYFRLRLFNPDRILSWLEPIFRPLLSKWGLLAWVIWVGLGLSVVVGQWPRMRESYESAMGPGAWLTNLPILMAAFLILKLIHEAGHGLICKRFGGQVPEFGAMLLVLVPAPYVDASSAWAFSSKWKRIAVGAGGMLFELSVAAAAALVWRNTFDGQLLNKLAFNIMLTSGISTILFNANPLMKFDGYYILSDLLEVPNLMQRSTQMLQFHCKKYLYRLRGVQSPTTDAGESVILNVFGVLALAYRIFLFFSITLYVMGTMFAVGLILAVWTAAMWFILPTLKFVHWLATGPQLAEKRGRVILTSLALIALVLFIVGGMPMADRRTSSGVVSSDEKSGVFFGVDGFVAAVHKRPGDAVKAGEPIVTLESHILQSQRKVAAAELDEARAVELRATAKSIPAGMVARERVQNRIELVAYVEDRAERLVVRAPHDGVVVGPDPADLVGKFVQEGEQLCEVVNTEPSHLRVTAGLSQTEVLWLYELAPDQYTVEVKRFAQADLVAKATPTRIPQAGQLVLEHAALGVAGGGGLETDMREQSGRVAKRPSFQAEFSLDLHAFGDELPMPGERVKLRFTLPDKPLLSQWVDRLQKLILGRARV